MGSAFVGTTVGPGLVLRLGLVGARLPDSNCNQMNKKQWPVGDVRLVLVYGLEIRVAFAATNARNFFSTRKVLHPYIG